MFPVSLDLFGDLPKDRERSPTNLQTLFWGDVLEASEPMTIGRHQWATVIWRRGEGGVYEAYIWRPVLFGQDGNRDLGWKREEHWPTYDHNRSDHGLPMTLRQLWMRNAEARRRHGIGGH